MSYTIALVTLELLSERLVRQPGVRGHGVGSDAAEHLLDAVLGHDAVEHPCRQRVAKLVGRHGDRVAGRVADVTATEPAVETLVEQVACEVATPSVGAKPRVAGNWPKICRCRTLLTTTCCAREERRSRPSAWQEPAPRLAGSGQSAAGCPCRHPAGRRRPRRRSQPSSSQSMAPPSARSPRRSRAKRSKLTASPSRSFQSGSAPSRNEPPTCNMSSTQNARQGRRGSPGLAFPRQRS